MSSPTTAEIRRARRNVELLLLEAETLVEHSPPREVVGEMLWASLQLAGKHRICGQCWLDMAARALGDALDCTVKISIEEAGE